MIFLDRYYDQIHSLEQKCPAHELQISFKWRDAFDKGGSLFMSSTTLSIASLAYEKCCVLFNIAAIKSHLGAKLASEGVKNDVFLKLAAKHFQSAGGIFQALRHLTPSIGQEITPDLNSEVLNVLQTIMLAQAQELFFFKATNDNMKDMIVARVANQCEELYMESLKHLPILKLAGIEKDWNSIVSMKQMAFLGIAEYHQALVCGERKDFGEQIARLQKSVENLKTAENKASYYFTASYKIFVGKAERLLEEARKDNDFIYHARIPDQKALEPIGKATLVQPTPLPSKFRDSPDPFENLLPVAVQRATQKLDARRQEVIHQETTALRESTNVMNGLLASLNLPASLEDANSAELPPSIREKAEQIKNKGGIQALESLINELPSLLKRNKEILEVTENMLKQEEDSDNNFRQQFKEKWTRSPSSKLTGVMKDHITKYRNIIQNAMDADERIKKKYAEHRDMIRLLSDSSNSEILGAIPTGSSPDSSLDSLNTPCAMQLKAYMSDVEALKREREQLEEEFKDANFDEVKANFKNELALNSALNEEALIVETVAKLYAPLQKRVRDSQTKQEALIDKIRKANEQFIATKRTSNSADSRRDQFMSKLAAAHDNFQELLVNCAEGTKFYNDLTTLLVNLQGKVDDLCFARKTEAEELCKSIQQDIVSRPDGSIPSVPSYQADADKSKPPRPPPPQSQPSSYTPAPNYSFPPSPYPQAPNYYIPPPQLPMSFSSYANPYAPYPQQQQPYPTPYPPYPSYPPNQPSSGN